MQNDTPLSEMTQFSLAFRTGLKHCKYATWAADLTEGQLLVLLWLVGECEIRGFMYSTLVEELPKREGHQEQKRMIIALKMLYDLIKGRISLQEVREHIDSSCNKKVMAQMQTEMIGFSEDFRAQLRMGKYTRWVLYRDFTEESLFGLISLVGEYGHRAFFLREISHRSGCFVRMTVAFKMLAKMVRGQRWSFNEMCGEIHLSLRRDDTKLWDDWPSIDTKVSETTSAEIRFEGIKVVVIHSYKNIAEIFLKTAGCEVITATNGFESLSKVMEHQPDIIFVELHPNMPRLNMPRLDGFQTCALIKDNPAFKKIPVVILSSWDGLSQRTYSKIVGADYYMTLPFTREELLNVIKTYVVDAKMAGEF